MLGSKLIPNNRGAPREGIEPLEANEYTPRSNAGAVQASVKGRAGTRQVVELSKKHLEAIPPDEAPSANKKAA